MKDLVDTLVRCFSALFILFALFAFVGAFITGCATAPAPKPKADPTPIAAIVVAECGKSVALYVILDDKHMALFAGAETVLYEAVAPSQLPKVSKADAVPIEVAMALAQRAPLTSHVVLPCADTTT